jgi:hypothetical protein
MGGGGGGGGGVTTVGTLLCNTIKYWKVVTEMWGLENKESKIG